MTSSTVRDWSIILAITLLAIATTLGLVRFLAPGLLGIQQDLQLVSVDKKVPPFFEGALRTEDWANPAFILQDPLTRVRAKPFFPTVDGMGPNDLLGFRNHAVPNQADIVVIGDSQTYGNNATIDTNWPGHLSHALASKNTSVYTMATGGWGPIQYFYAFQKALFFRPKVIIVAFYTGNDAFDAFQMAYGNPEWGDFKTDSALSDSDLPAVQFPPPKEKYVTAKLLNGHTTVLTPHYRYLCNQPHPAIDAGYAIMLNVARELGRIANEEGVTLITTLIPTKEYVYRDSVADQSIPKAEDYAVLVESEANRIKGFEQKILQSPGIHHISVANPLSMTAATAPQPLYPAGPDGHPLAEGYSAIASLLAPRVTELLETNASGLMALQNKDSQQLLLVHKQKYVVISNVERMRKLGWRLTDIPVWNELPNQFRELASEASMSDEHLRPKNYITAFEKPQ